MGEAPGTYRKLRLMDAGGMSRVLLRMAHEVVEALDGTKDVVLIGIRTRGVPLARRLAVEIERAHRLNLPVGLLDITLYRDDLSTVASSPVLKRTEIAFPVEEKVVVLCDDVLYTGRTVRAAMDAVLDFGRPRKILLAVLVDRGRRELPIEAQFVGKKVATSSSEIVSVTFRETDGADEVWLLDRVTARARKPSRRKAAERRNAASRAKAAPRVKASPARRKTPPSRTR